MQLLIRLVITSLSLFVAAWLVPGIRVESNGWAVFAAMAVILGLVNAIRVHPRAVDSTNCCGCLVFKIGSRPWSYLGSCRKCCHIRGTRFSRGDDPTTLPFIAYFKLTHYRRSAVVTRSW